MTTELESACTKFIKQQRQYVAEQQPRESYYKIRDNRHMTVEDHSNLSSLYDFELKNNASLQELAFLLTPLLRSSVMLNGSEADRVRWIDCFADKMLEQITFKPKPTDKPDFYGQPAELIGLSELYEQIGYLRGSYISESQQIDYETRLAKTQSELADRAVVAGYTIAVVFVYQGKGDRTVALESAIIDSFDKHADSFASYEEFQGSFEYCQNNRLRFIGPNAVMDANALKSKALHDKILLADDNASLAWLADRLARDAKVFSADRQNPALQEKFDSRFAASPLQEQYWFLGNNVEYLAPSVYYHKAFEVMTKNVIKESRKSDLSISEADVLEGAVTFILSNIDRKHAQFLPMLRVLTRLGESETTNPILASQPLLPVPWVRSEAHPLPQEVREAVRQPARPDLRAQPIGSADWSLD